MSKRVYTEEQKKRKKKYNEDYRKRNPEKIAKLIKTWEDIHKERIKESKKAYYIKNKEHLAKCKKEYYELHKEALKEKRKSLTPLTIKKSQERRLRYQRVSNFLLNKKSCDVCGKSFHPSLLDLHHVERESKRKSVSCLYASPSASIVERKKCIVLCVLCHLSFHAGILQIDKVSISRSQKKYEIFIKPYQDFIDSKKKMSFFYNMLKDEGVSL